MKPLAISVLTICGIEELPAQEAREVTHVLSLLDPDWPEIDAFQRYGSHHRTTLHFHDIIERAPGRIAPTPADMAATLGFRADLQAGRPHPAESSEEATSELQSLLSISYAASCSKTKQKHKHPLNYHTTPQHVPTT